MSGTSFRCRFFFADVSGKRVIFKSRKSVIFGLISIDVSLKASDPFSVQFRRCSIIMCRSVPQIPPVFHRCHTNDSQLCPRVFRCAPGNFTKTEMNSADISEYRKYLPMFTSTSKMRPRSHGECCHPPLHHCNLLLENPEDHSSTQWPYVRVRPAALASVWTYNILPFCIQYGVYLGE